VYSKVVPDKATVKAADRYEVVYDLSIGTIFSAVERTTPNPDFKITPIFDAEYLSNNRR